MPSQSNLCLGPWSAALEGDSFLMDQAHQLYHSWMDDQGPSQIRITLKSCSQKSDHEHGQPEVQGHRSDHEATLRVGNMKATWRQGEGHLTVSPEQKWFLRMAMRFFAIEEAMHRDHFLVLHSSAVKWQGQALLFPGVSGSGKSTCARRAVAMGADLLSDDTVIVDLQTSAQVHPHPIWSFPERTDRSQNNHSLPVGGLIVHQKAPASQCVPTSRSAAAACLVECSLPSQARGAQDFLLKVERLLNLIPAWRMDVPLTGDLPLPAWQTTC